MMFRLLGALLLAASFPLSLYAVTVEGLFGATVSVADHSAAENDRGIDEAFAQVLVKLTGNSGSAADPRFAKLRRKAQKFVTVVGQAEGGGAADGFRLRVEFDAKALAAALREEGVEPWPKERPALKAWFAVQDPDGRRFTPGEADREVFEALARRGNERGIPLTRPPLPRLSSKPDPNLLRTLLPDGQEPAAQPALAALLETRDRAHWKLSWRLLIENEPTEWQAEGEDPVALVQQGFDRAGDLVAGHFVGAMAGSGPENVPLRLLGLRSADDFGLALKRLRELDVVQRVDITRATDEVLELRLVARGGLGSVNQGLKLDPAFTPEPGAAGSWRFNGSAR